MGRVSFTAAACALVAIGSCGGETTRDAIPADDAEATHDAAMSARVNVGEIAVDLGSAGGLSALFQETADPAAIATTTGSPLATVNDDTRQCTAYVEPDPPPADTAPEFVSAGPITVTGGPTPLTLWPADAGPVADYYGRWGALAPGSTVTITGDGSQDVPPFTVSLAIPNVVTWSSPSSSGPWMIQQSHDLPVVWTGGGAVGSVSVDIGDHGANVFTGVTCVFPEGSNGGVLPASLLDLLPRGDEQNGNSDFSVSVQEEVMTTSNGWTFIAEAEATITSGLVTLE